VTEGHETLPTVVVGMFPREQLQAKGIVTSSSFEEKDLRIIDAVKAEIRGLNNICNSFIEDFNVCESKNQLLLKVKISPEPLKGQSKEDYFIEILLNNRDSHFKGFLDKEFSLTVGSVKEVEFLYELSSEMNKVLGYILSAIQGSDNSQWYLYGTTCLFKKGTLKLKEKLKDLMQVYITKDAMDGKSGGLTSQAKSEIIKKLRLEMDPLLKAAEKMIAEMSEDKLLAPTKIKSLKGYIKTYNLKRYLDALEGGLNNKDPLSSWDKLSNCVEYFNKSLSCLNSLQGVAVRPELGLAEPLVCRGLNSSDIIEKRIYNFKNKLLIPKYVLMQLEIVLKKSPLLDELKKSQPQDFETTSNRIACLLKGAEELLEILDTKTHKAIKEFRERIELFESREEDETAEIQECEAVVGERTKKRLTINPLADIKETKSLEEAREEQKILELATIEVEKSKEKDSPPDDDFNEDFTPGDFISSPSSASSAPTEVPCTKHEEDSEVGSEDSTEESLIFTMHFNATKTPASPSAKSISSWGGSGESPSEFSAESPREFSDESDAVILIDQIQFGFLSEEERKNKKEMEALEKEMEKIKNNANSFLKRLETKYNIKKAFDKMGAKNRSREAADGLWGVKHKIVAL